MSLKRVTADAISGNPQNPRTITDDKSGKLVQSLIEFPEMLFIRPIVIGSEGISLGGNMRLAAIQEIRDYTATYKGEILDEQRSIRKQRGQTEAQKAEFEKAINHLLYEDDYLVQDVSYLSQEKQDEFIVKDNISYGEWDFASLDSLWGKETVAAWGLDIPKWIESKEEKNNEKEVDEDSLQTDHVCPKCGYEFS